MVFQIGVFLRVLIEKQLGFFLSTFNLFFFFFLEKTINNHFPETNLVLTIQLDFSNLYEASFYYFHS